MPLYNRPLNNRVLYNRPLYNIPLNSDPRTTHHCTTHHCTLQQTTVQKTPVQQTAVQQTRPNTPFVQTYNENGTTSLYNTSVKPYKRPLDADSVYGGTKSLYNGTAGGRPSTPNQYR